MLRIDANPVTHRSYNSTLSVRLPSKKRVRPNYPSRFSLHARQQLSYPRKGHIVFERAVSLQRADVQQGWLPKTDGEAFLTPSPGDRAACS